MRPIKEMKLKVHVDREGEDGFSGYLNVGPKNRPRIIVSWGGGWEHASVSYPNRTPTWGEMCRAKEAFWLDDETVIQYHPTDEEYRQVHPYCLHLWRSLDDEMPVPPPRFVA